MTTMVSNILDYAKLQSKRLELDLQPMSIKDLLTNVIDMHKIKAKQKNIKLNMQMDKSAIPEKVYADQCRLTQILINLVSNAIKFTASGGVSIHVNWFPDGESSNNASIFNKESSDLAELLNAN